MSAKPWTPEPEPPEDPLAFFRGVLWSLVYLTVGVLAWCLGRLVWPGGGL